MQLEEGIRDFDINEIEINEGILFIKNKQLVLYIYDCYKTVDEEDNLSRYHVSDCRTIHEMKDGGRYDRYIATSNKTGSFKISYGLMKKEVKNLNSKKVSMFVSIA